MLPYARLTYEGRASRATMCIDTPFRLFEPSGDLLSGGLRAACLLSRPPSGSVDEAVAKWPCTKVLFGLNSLAQGLNGRILFFSTYIARWRCCMRDVRVFPILSDVKLFEGEDISDVRLRLFLQFLMRALGILFVHTASPPPGDSQEAPSQGGTAAPQIRWTKRLHLHQPGEIGVCSFRARNSVFLQWLLKRLVIVKGRVWSGGVVHPKYRSMACLDVACIF